MNDNEMVDEASEDDLDFLNNSNGDTIDENEEVKENDNSGIKTDQIDLQTLAEEIYEEAINGGKRPDLVKKVQASYDLRGFPTAWVSAFILEFEFQETTSAALKDSQASFAYGITLPEQDRKQFDSFERALMLSEPFDEGESGHEHFVNDFIALNEYVVVIQAHSSISIQNTDTDLLSIGSVLEDPSIRIWKRDFRIFFRALPGIKLPIAETPIKEKAVDNFSFPSKGMLDHTCKYPNLRLRLEKKGEEDLFYSIMQKTGDCSYHQIKSREIDRQEETISHELSKSTQQLVDDDKKNPVPGKEKVITLDHAIKDILSDKRMKQGKKVSILFEFCQGFSSQSPKPDNSKIGLTKRTVEDVTTFLRFKNNVSFPYFLKRALEVIGRNHKHYKKKFDALKKVDLSKLKKKYEGKELRIKEITSLDFLLMLDRQISIREGNSNAYTVTDETNPASQVKTAQLNILEYLQKKVRPEEYFEKQGKRKVEAMVEQEYIEIPSQKTLEEKIRKH